MAGLIELLLSGMQGNPQLRLGGEDTPAGGGLLDAVGQRIMQQQYNPQMGGAAPLNAPQQAREAPQSAMAAPQVSMPQQGGGWLLGRLFGGQRGPSNGTVQWLINKGFDPGTAQLYASDPQLLRSAVAKYGGPQAAPDPKDNLMSVGENSAIYDAQSGQWIKNPYADKGDDDKAPQVVELFDQQTGQPYKATWNKQKGEYERVGGIKARSDGLSITTNPDGTTSVVMGGANAQPKLTESEGRSAGFYGRSVKSHDILNSLEDQGTSLWNNTVGNLPVVGNYALSQDAQKYDQARRDFINAVLRRESGAVITPEEFANAEKQYFPQPGDGPEVIAQKRRNRETTIQGLKVSSGQGANFAFPPEQGQPAQSHDGGWQDMGNGVKIRRKQ